jgi:hypothetical protein
MSDAPRRRRPRLSHVLANWRQSDESFLTKLRLTARNNWTKMRTRQNCCGNEGQPGC